MSVVENLLGYWRFYTLKHPDDKALFKYIEKLTGNKPRRLFYYKKALRHRSYATQVSRRPKSNERLEYLGDAVLDLLVGEYLFKRFQKENEGFLSKMRSRITSRESLNEIALRLEIPQFLQHRVDPLPGEKTHSIYGNALEALIGAIFLDQGFDLTRAFFYKKLLHRHIRIRELLKTISNYKSVLLEWSQKTGRKVQYQPETVEENGESLFVVRVLVDGELMGEGMSRRKKKAEQRAAGEAVAKLDIKTE